MCQFSLVLQKQNKNKNEKEQNEEKTTKKSKNQEEQNNLIKFSSSSILVYSLQLLPSLFGTKTFQERAEIIKNCYKSLP